MTSYVSTHFLTPLPLASPGCPNPMQPTKKGCFDNQNDTNEMSLNLEKCADDTQPQQNFRSWQ